LYSSGVRPALIVSTSELMLKGGNRQRWLRLLAKNISETLGERASRVQLRQARIIVYPDSEPDEELAREVSMIPGVRWVGIGYVMLRDQQLLLKLSEELVKSTGASKVAVKVHRSDKSFPKTSLEVMREVSDRLRSSLRIAIDLKNPQLTIWVNILPEEFLLAWKRVEGVGGLPVGASGRVLALLSGGIDSPVAAWLMMKRGCIVDALHVYAQPTAEGALAEKMKVLFERLRRFSKKSRLYLAPYHHFLELVMRGDTRLELALFRRFLNRLAEAVAKEIGALAIVTGDSLGQAASQTLESIYAASFGLELQVLRPLIGMDKEEVVNLSKSLGLFEISTMEYKDCCSIIVRHPEPRPRLEAVNMEWERLGLDRAVQQTLKEIVVYDGTTIAPWKNLSSPPSLSNQE